MRILLVGAGRVGGADAKLAARRDIFSTGEVGRPWRMQDVPQ